MTRLTLLGCVRGMCSETPPMRTAISYWPSQWLRSLVWVLAERWSSTDEPSTMRRKCFCLFLGSSINHSQRSFEPWRRCLFRKKTWPSN